jgi:hypothetical protein
MPGEANAMVKIMCERVDLSLRAGRYIMFMCQIKHRLPGDLVDMVEVAQLIKYVSENQEDLKPQFKKNGSQETGTIREPNKTRTWYKPANPM